MVLFSELWVLVTRGRDQNVSSLKLPLPFLSYQLIFPCQKKIVTCNNLIKWALVFTGLLGKDSLRSGHLFVENWASGKLLHRCVARCVWGGLTCSRLERFDLAVEFLTVPGFMEIRGTGSWSLVLGNWIKPLPSFTSTFCVWELTRCAELRHREWAWNSRSSR